MAIATATAIAAGITGAAAAGDLYSQKKARSAAEASRQYIQQMAEKTQNQLFQLYPDIQRTNAQQYNNSMDVLGRTFPATLSAFMGGNMNAQQTIAGALPQMNSAILGGGVDLTDYSQMQPRQVPIDASLAAYLANPPRMNFETIDPAKLR